MAPLAALSVQISLALVTAGATPLSTMLRGHHLLQPNQALAGRRLQEDALGGNYEHLGCFNDEGLDKVKRVLAVPNMTTMMCHTYCDAKGAAYMATQYGNECWCVADPRKDLEGSGAGVCDALCEGDDTQTCGGTDAFDLYKLEWASEPDDEEFVGCFGDDKDDRVLDEMIVTQSMTPSVCREHCVDKAAKFYATQYGNECFCGTSSDVSDYQVHGTGICHMRCAGEYMTSCGGYEAFNLYRMDDAEPDVSIGDDAGEYANLLSLHNKNRCMHNAGPLVWDTEIYKTAEQYAAYLTQDEFCGRIFHNTSPYGENLYTCGSTGGFGCYSDEAAMKKLFDDELIVPSDVTTYEGHATAILWKSTERIGCAVAKCEKDGWYTHTLVCNFDPEGNYKPELLNQVEPPSGEDPSTCGF
ncbi:unnamed protein product [Ascophyllum nodosum]